MTRSKSYRRLGAYTMNKPRRADLKTRFKGYLSSPKAGNIRIKPITGATERWGVSSDENVRTQILSSSAGKLGGREKRWAYHQRSHQGVLVWRTRSRVLRKTYGEDVGTPKHGIASHTPGIKTQVVGGTKGALTDEHGTRDNLRAAAVNKTLGDGSRGWLDLATMGKLATIQLMMSPQEELALSRSSVTAHGSQDIHSVFPSIGKVSRTKGFDQLSGTVHEVREREKLVAATMLLKAGRNNLVPEGHKQLLTHSGGDVDGALEYLRHKSAKSKTSFEFNTGKYSRTDRLDERSLRRMDRDAGKGRDRSRALSPPRRLPPKPTGYPF